MGNCPEERGGKCADDREWAITREGRECIVPCEDAAPNQAKLPNRGLFPSLVRNHKCQSVNQRLRGGSSDLAQNGEPSSFKDSEEIATYPQMAQFQRKPGMDV